MKSIFILTAMTCSVAAHAQNELYINGASLYINTSCIVKVNGNAQLQSGSTLTNNGSLAVTGNVTNNSTIIAANTGDLIFNGTAAQALSGSGTYNAKNVTVNNSNGVTLNVPLRIDGTCSFVNGLITAATTANALTFTTNGSISSSNQPTDASHVNGYVIKEGTGSFSYPVGDAVKYQKVDVNATANAGGMRVRYIAADAGNAAFVTTGASPTPLVAYNAQEYWDIAPVTTATGNVTIYWDNYKNSGITNTADLQVAHKSGSSWLNEGAASVTGTIAAGSVQSLAGISTWSPFTLGSRSPSTPLPLSWLSVSASLNSNKHVVVQWQVQEQDVERYDVEQSADGRDYSIAGTQLSMGDGTNRYRFEEAGQLRGTAFYRIRQTNADGQFRYSETISVSSNDRSDAVLIYPLPFHDHFYVKCSKAGSAVIRNLQGQVLQAVPLQSGDNYVDATGLSTGMYLFTTDNGHSRQVIKRQAPLE